METFERTKPVLRRGVFGDFFQDDATRGQDS